MSFDPGVSGISGASDVFLSAPVTNDSLSYDAAIEKWKNQVVDKTRVGLSNVDNTTDLNKPISTATQTALDAKAATAHTHTATQISDSTAVGRSVVVAANVAAARTAIGAADAATSVQFAGSGPGRIWTQTTEPTSAVDGDWWVSI